MSEGRGGVCVTRNYVCNILSLKKIHPHPTLFRSLFSRLGEVISQGHGRGTLGALFLVYRAPANYLRNRWLSQKGARGAQFFLFSHYRTTILPIRNSPHTRTYYSPCASYRAHSPPVWHTGAAHSLPIAGTRWHGGCSYGSQLR